MAKTRRSLIADRFAPTRCTARVIGPGVLLCGLLICPVLQADAEESADSSAATQLQEVTVTADRRQESNQHVPLAIEVISADTAEMIGVTDTQSLPALVPGLLFNRQVNSSVPFLRGVGTPVGQSGDEPSVALYIDDVYLPAGSASLSQFSNIEHIEVEKGPQGTLFGRNATGGVVQIFTRNATDQPELKVTGGWANYDTPSGNLYANTPITPELFANVSVDWSDQSQGWGRDITTGAPAFKARDYNARAKLLWKPSEATTALLTLDFSATGTQQGLGFKAFPGTGSLDPLPPYPNGGFQSPAGYYDPNENVNSHGTDRQFGVSLKINHDLHWAEFVSISAYRDTRADYSLDEDIGPLPIVNVQIATPETTFTQEMQLISPSGGPLTWIAGAFVYNDKAAFNPIRFSGSGFAPLPVVYSYGEETAQSYALFAQGTATILENTHLTAGVRYTLDEREERAGASYAGAPLEMASNSPQSKSWDSPTWHSTLDRQLTPDIMAYLGYSRGFKSGLFNPVVLPGSPIDAPVNPETLSSYTTGFKSEYLEHRLRVNVEGFYYDYKNIQVEQILQAVTHITNAASATIRGVDLDMSAMPIDRLTLTVSLEAMQGTYGSFMDGTFFVYNPVTGGNCTYVPIAPPAPQACAGATPPNFNSATGTWDLKGNHTIQTPPFSSSLTAQYKTPTPVGQLDWNVSWSHTGDYYASPDNGEGQIAPSTPANDKQKLIDLVNASTGWTSPGQNTAVRLWVKNLSSVKYWSYADEISFATFYSPAPPRTFGFTVTQRFE